MESTGVSKPVAVGEGVCLARVSCSGSGVPALLQPPHLQPVRLARGKMPRPGLKVTGPGTGPGQGALLGAERGQPLIDQLLASTLKKQLSHALVSLKIRYHFIRLSGGLNEIIFFVTKQVVNKCLF